MIARLTIGLLGVSILLSGSPVPRRIELTVSAARVSSGETVAVTIRLPIAGRRAETPPNALLLTPSIGVETLQLHAVARSPSLIYTTNIHLPQSAPQGLYIVHAWTGDRNHPSRIGKATFLLGRVVGDFLIASALDERTPRADLAGYLDQFQAFGGNFLIAHNLITPDRAYFPCAICKRPVKTPDQPDIVDLLLNEADRRGYPVLLSVGWDMTRDTRYQDRMKQTVAILAELYANYARHPSFVGFYSFQEGSGTYYVSYIREFSRSVKDLNPTLLTACAPYIDDPLLAGYLGAVTDLDMIIWQSGVMASYRPDNRKEYPLRRVKDFCSLAVGAKQLQGKLALTHVELFGYLENSLAPDVPATGYKNIYQQILSAANVANSDGIMLFTYQFHIYNLLKSHAEVRESQRAVTDGLHAFQLIASQVSSRPNPLAVYVPYSDWVIERWTNSFLPALDAFRILGIPLDVLPYSPPLEEAILPYYPVHMNPNVLARLIKSKTVLILPDVSGFQQTDSDLIKAFVEQGGAVVAFGPQIPMGRSYERAQLFGGEQTNDDTHTAIVVKDALGRGLAAGTRYSLGNMRLPAWVPTGGRVIATFEDGSAAILINSFGKGKAVTILPDAATAARSFPELTRDAIDYALSSVGSARPADVLGANERVDTAIEETSEGFSTAVINHNPRDIDITLRPHPRRPHERLIWIDLATQQPLSPPAESLQIRVPAGGFRAIGFRLQN